MSGGLLARGTHSSPFVSRNTTNFILFLWMVGAFSMDCFVGIWPSAIGQEMLTVIITAVTKPLAEASDLIIEPSHSAVCIVSRIC